MRNVKIAGAGLTRFGKFLDRGIPTNTSGGLLSKGHPIGATGCGQLVELVEQLRGRAGKRQVRGARMALAENGGGYPGKDAAAAAVHTLAK